MRTITGWKTIGHYAEKRESLRWHGPNNHLCHVALHHLAGHLYSTARLLHCGAAAHRRRRRGGRAPAARHARVRAQDHARQHLGPAAVHQRDGLADGVDARAAVHAHLAPVALLLRGRVRAAASDPPLACILLLLLAIQPTRDAAATEAPQGCVSSKATCQQRSTVRREQPVDTCC